ncbi:MAG: twin-arginine translocation signal domain-containing protein, partial [Beijerinckiaceae bacterium]
MTNLNRRSLLKGGAAAGAA